MRSRRLALVPFLLGLFAVGCGDLSDIGEGGGGMVYCPDGERPIPVCAANGGCAGGEQGRMVGMVEAHNGVRAAQSEPRPGDPLPTLRWSDDLAAVAQAWAEHLTAASRDCGRLVHSRDCRYGENLAFFSGFEPSAAEVVEAGWASEQACYGFGRFMTTDSCSSDCDAFSGCGHFTQIIWRDTTEVGCASSPARGSPARSGSATTPPSATSSIAHRIS